MRRTTLWAAAIAALALNGAGVNVALAGSADAPAIMPSPWTGFIALGAMVALFILEIV